MLLAMQHMDRLRTVAEMTSIIAHDIRNPLAAIKMQAQLARIRPDAAENDGYVGIDVMDHGTGIPEQEQSKIWNMYYTTKGNGNGIGLAMAKRIVELYDWQISLASKVGEGTTFTIRFPKCSGDREKQLHT